MIMFSNFLQPCISEPVRIVKGSKPCLVNNFFVNLLNHIYILLCGNLYKKISDHLPHFLIIKNMTNVRQKWEIKTSGKTARDMKNFNQEKYLNDLKELENQSVVGTNANEVFDKY